MLNIMESMTLRHYRSPSEINSAMLGVYNNMFLGLATSMIVSMLVASSAGIMAFLFTGVMKWIVMFLPLAAVFAISFALNANPPKPIAHLLLHLFAAIMGLSFATIFVVFKLGSIVSAFMGALILFGAMSFYGYFTKSSLHNLSGYLLVGLIAIIVASIINIFLASSVMAMVISAIAIILFLALTAYDSQRIREEIQDADSNLELVKVTGALSLYLNFINIFLNLLNLFGNRE